MHYVLFEGTALAEKAALSEEYYKILQHEIKSSGGFISETPFGHPTQPNGQLLFATFADDAAIIRWRNNSVHLRIMHEARHSIFSDYRIRVGAVVQEGGSTLNPRSEVTMILYQRPTEEFSAAQANLSYILNPDSSKEVLDEVMNSNFYVGEESSMWISAWPNEVNAIQFQNAVKRQQNDELIRIRLLREYGKNERKEAPRNIDAAELRAVGKAEGGSVER